MSAAGRSLLTVARFATRSLNRRSVVRIEVIQRMASTDSKELSGTTNVVAKDEVVRFIRDCLCKAGTTTEDGQVVGHHLMTADYSGHFSHGLNRLKLYVHDLESKITDPAAKPEIVTDFQVRRVLTFNFSQFSIGER